MMFGGEGLCLTKFSHTGTAWLQGVPFPHLAERIVNSVPGVTNPKPPADSELSVGGEVSSQTGSYRALLSIIRFRNSTLRSQSRLLAENSHYTFFDSVFKGIFLQ